MLEKILQKPESYRNKLALAMSVSLSLLILASFAFYKGYLSFGAVKPSAQTASVANSVPATAPSPLDSSKKTLMRTWEEIDGQYVQLKESISNVLVPFITGIEVYERK